MRNKILSDKGTHYFVETAPIMPGGKPRRHKIRRFLCIGGPLDKQWRSSEELYHEASLQYTPFNNAGSSLHSMIYVYKELLA